jgi:iron complex transport system substrate-binding protein
MMKLISICPSNTELLGYLGLTDHIIAVDDYSDWPDKIQQLPRLGPDLSIDMDKLESMNPDLVVASLSVPGMEKNVEELKKRNIPYIVLNPNSLDDIANDLLLLGKATETTRKAEQLIEKYHQFLYEYEKRAKEIDKKPALYWEWWPKPVFTPGKLNWLTKISELAGATNVYSDVEAASVQTTWDDVKSRNPDYICLAWVGVKQNKINPDLVTKRPDWSEMDAVQKERIFVLEEPLYCRPSPKLLLGLKKLASLLHPDVFPKDDGKDPLLNHE